MESNSKDLKSQILINNLVEGEYCILIHELVVSSLGNGVELKLKYIYKSLKDFEKQQHTEPHLYYEWREYE